MSNVQCSMSNFEIEHWTFDLGHSFDRRCLMNRKVLSIAVLAGALTWACGEPAAGPDATLRPSLMADGVPEDVGPYGVGHTMIQVVHTGSAGERRPLDVHVWYPAHPAGVTAAPRTAYRSRLFGVPLVPGTYDPLTFTIPSPLAHEGADIDARGPRFPLLIWSHGSGTDALDHAFTAEAIASHGFVVASAEHTNNSQDDARGDYINQLVGSSLPACLDALQPPCGGAGVLRHALQQLPALCGRKRRRASELRLRPVRENAGGGRRASRESAGDPGRPDGPYAAHADGGDVRQHARLLLLRCVRRAGGHQTARPDDHGRRCHGE